MRQLLIAGCLVGVGSAAAWAQRPVEFNRVEFNRDVRPILSDRCFHCHGTDAKAKGITLRLDHEATAKADLGKGRRAIVDGQPDESELVKRITTTQPARRMPPPYSGLSLTAAEMETLRNWVAQGAPWQQHWSFTKPVRPELPAVNKADWVRNPIDRFILARLAKEGLAPSPEAPKETLLRRVSLDLTGLPPTVAEVDAFVKDSRPDAYERAVDRLLASPRYAERMAYRWLDAARYADTNGYQFDGERVMWRWRDWVIDSFQRNQPYDQFLVEQMAGDLLPNATLSQKVATGFHRNHRANTEDGIIPEEYQVEYVMDRVETTSMVFLGVTLGCARCHNHKYDPFTQREFYQMYAYFNSVPEMGRAMKYGNSPPVVLAPTAEQQRTLDTMEERIQAAEQALQRHEGKLAKLQRAWEAALRQQQPVHWAPQLALEYQPEASQLPHCDGAAAGPRTAVPACFDGQAVVSAANVAMLDIQDRWTLATWVYAEGVPDGSLISRMADNPQGKGFGLHLDKGRVHVNLTSTYADDAIRVETEQPLTAGQWHHVLATYDGSVSAGGITIYVDGQPQKLKVLLDTLYRPFRNAGAKFTQPLRLAGGWGPERRFRGQMDDPRVYSRLLSADEVAALAYPGTVNAIAQQPEAQRSAAERFLIRAAFLATAAPAELKTRAEQLAQLRLERERFERSCPTVMVMEDRPGLRESHILQRGQYNMPGEKVTPGTPAVLPPLPADAPKNRLTLARWMTAPDHPLTSRVAVNRYWQMLFGTGLVKTTEDFGLQGEWPSHPELMDWLATEFVQNGWDTKAMLKLLVTSATYRQSSKATPELLQKDPENRLLARGPRQRLPAEMVRDQALFAAGLLAEKVGGPSVKPYQPAGLWKEVVMQDMEYDQGHGADLYRRSLYTFWKRTVAPPMLTNFDAAARETCTVRESRTNTPLQALNLMNDVQFVEAARVLGQRMLREGGKDDAARLRYGFRTLLARQPSAPELQLLEQNLRYHRQHFTPERAKEFLRHGEAPVSAKLDPRELAAYAATASLMLNLDEAVTKE